MTDTQYYSIMEAIRVILMPENHSEEEVIKARAYLIALVGQYDN